MNNNLFFRKIVREVLEETFFKGSRMDNYPHSGVKFPYDDFNHPSKPEEIDTTNYVMKYNSWSDNNDSYNFPFKEFDLGLEIEKARNPLFNIYDLASKVVSNLKSDKDFYSKITKIELGKNDEANN